VQRSAVAVAVVALAVVALAALAAGVSVGGDHTDPACAQNESAECPGFPFVDPPQPTRDAADFGAVLPGCPAVLASSGRALLFLGGVTAAAALLARRRGPVLPALVATPVVLAVASACLPFPGAGGLSGGVRLHPLAVAAVGLAVPLAAAGVALYAVLSGDETDAADGEDDETLDAIGEVAGEAADRIETDADATNEVYRAWREMVRHLDVANPDATTPEQFASAAVEAGMRREHVEALTRLFEDVRYGGRDATDREAAALDALREIEAAYAGDGGDGA
jgi:hypothetical protein